MSAARINPIESVEAPFSRARSHALATEATLSSTEMIRKRRGAREAGERLGRGGGGAFVGARERAPAS